MEDQQSRPGDLKDESGKGSADGDESNEAATESADTDNGDAVVDRAGDDDTGTAGEATAEDSAQTSDTARPANRWTGRRPAVAVGAAAALFVGAAAFAGFTLQPYLADRAQVAIKTEVARTAVNAITTLWNYTPENMDTLVDRASVYLSGDLEADYRKFIDAIAETNKQAKVTDSTQVTAAAVESLDGHEATVLLYTNTSATSELKGAVPSLKYLSYRLSMRRDHHRWVITKMPTVTSLNLTPRV